MRDALEVQMARRRMTEVEDEVEQVRDDAVVEGRAGSSSDRGDSLELEPRSTNLSQTGIGHLQTIGPNTTS